MTKLLQAFDATQVDPTQGGGGGFPIGKHPVIINGSEIKGTKDNTGGMLVLNLQVIDGPNKGLEGPYRLNLYNQTQQAADIAHKQLSAICHVTQTYKVEDVQVLYNKPFIIEVGLQRGEEAAAKGYTEIKKVYDMNGNEPGKPATAAPAAPQPAPAPQASWGTPPAAESAPAASAAAWGAPAGPAPATPAAPAWGGGQPAAPAAAPAPQGSWQGAPAAGGPAPWGQR